jgi:riboflavin kinase/FMN adenylyltransferase
MLALPYMLKGKIIEGRQIGRRIGFPTANLQYDEDFIIPAKGVYYTIVDYNNKLYKGITSVGYNPTVHPTGDKLTIETYLLDFDRNIYGESIRLYFINRMRDEFKFNSLDELVIQLNKDRDYAKEQQLEKFSFIMKK